MLRPCPPLTRPLPSHTPSQAISSAWPESRTVLEKLRGELEGSLDKLTTRERFLNDQFERLMSQYRAVRQQLTVVQVRRGGGCRVQVQGGMSGGGGGGTPIVFTEGLELSGSPAPLHAFTMPPLSRRTRTMPPAASLTLLTSRMPCTPRLTCAQSTYNARTEAISDRNSELHRITEQLTEMKSIMDEHSTNIADATPVVSGEVRPMHTSVPVVPSM